MTADGYQSPMSHRYGSCTMRQLWGEVQKRLLWRHIWVNLAEAEMGLGAPFSPEDLYEVRAHQTEVDLEASAAEELVTRHDLMAELRVFARQCGGAGGILHAGATSSDIEDNADALRVRSSIYILLNGLGYLSGVLARMADRYAGTPTMAFTHLQPAEPTTVGHRAALWLQDLRGHRANLLLLCKSVRGKGFKGAVGTSASYVDLLGRNAAARALDEEMSRRLDLPFYDLAAQTYPRIQDYEVVSALAGVGASLHKMALDVRLLQSPLSGELSEGTLPGQVGSSAMPFKRNPIQCEKVCSLTRSLSVMPQVAWQNAAQSALERTLDDSANRRSMLPEAFLTCEEAINTMGKVMSGVSVSTNAAGALLARHWPFASTERILMAAVRAGMDRQEAHERLRQHSANALAAMAGGGRNDLLDQLSEDPYFHSIPGFTLMMAKLEDPSGYTGLAKDRAREAAAAVLTPEP